MNTELYLDEEDMLLIESALWWMKTELEEKIEKRDNQCEYYKVIHKEHEFFLDKLTVWLDNVETKGNNYELKVI